MMNRVDKDWWCWQVFAKCTRKSGLWKANDQHCPLVSTFIEAGSLDKFPQNHNYANERQRATRTKDDGTSCPGLKEWAEKGPQVSSDQPLQSWHSL
jgi:hypothetical protein